MRLSSFPARALALALAALALPAPTSGAAPPKRFLAPDGASCAIDEVLGRTTVRAVLLAKPWEGYTAELLRLWDRTFARRPRGVRTLVVFVRASRAQVARYVAAHRFSFRWLVDPTGVTLESVAPPVLPYAVLVDPTGRMVFRSPAPREDQLRLIAQNPGRAARLLGAAAASPLPLPRLEPTGPWGPPRPKDQAYGGDQP